MQKTSVREFIRNFAKVRNTHVEVFKNNNKVGTWIPSEENVNQLNEDLSSS